FWYEEGIETGSAIALCEIGYLMLESDESSDTAREHHTDPVGIGVVLVKSRVGHRLIAGNKCKLREAIYLSCFLPVEMLNGIEVLDLAGEFCSEFRCIKLCDRISTGNAIDQSIPIFINRIPQRSKGSHSGNYYPFQFHRKYVLVLR